MSVVTTVYVAIVALLTVWGVWLLATDDPDGGRHPAGAAMVTVAVVAAALRVVTLRRSQRR
jgi:hypothetical protein